MPEDEIFQETVTRVEKPSSHFTLLRAPNGDFLGASEEGFAIFDYVDDKAIWDTVGEGYRHVATGFVVEVESPRSKDGDYLRHQGKWLASDGTLGDVAALFVPGHGPAHLPSEYLKSFRENGWVCVPSIIAPDVVEELERISCTGRWESGEFDRSVAPLPPERGGRKNRDGAGLLVADAPIYGDPRYSARTFAQLCHTPQR